MVVAVRVNVPPGTGLSIQGSGGSGALEPAVTRVGVEHRGFDRVPAGSAAHHGFPDSAPQMRLAEWWRDLLESLGRHARAL